MFFIPMGCFRDSWLLRSSGSMTRTNARSLFFACEAKEECLLDRRLQTEGYHSCCLLMIMMILNKKVAPLESGLTS